MSELAELYAFFAVIYLLECAAWVPKRAVGLLAPAGRWRWRRPFCPNASWSRGGLLGTPWPPLSSPLITEPLPFLLGPDGLAYDDGRSFVPWDEVERVAAVGARLEVNGALAATLATRRGAAALADALAALPRLSPAQRAVRLERLLDARFDATTIGKRLPVFKRETRLLRIATHVLWAALFLGLPALIWLPLGSLFLALAAVGLISWVTSAVLFERTLRKGTGLPRPLWPDLTKRVVAASSPLATIRSPDLLARELAGDLDPLAAAAALVTPRTLGTLARPRLVELMFRDDGDLPAEAAADARWSRDQHLERIRRLLRAREVDVDGLLAAPRRDRDDIVAWCPSCLAQYAADPAREKSCPNDRCHGVSLVAY